VDNFAFLNLLNLFLMTMHMTTASKAGITTVIIMATQLVQGRTVLHTVQLRCYQ